MIDNMCHQVANIIGLQEDMMLGEKMSEAVEEKAVEREHLTYASKLVCRNTYHILVNSNYLCGPDIFFCTQW